MMRLRTFVAVFLALLVAVTSQEMAMLRGQPKAAGLSVFCINEVATQVAVDREGKPLGPQHICPDCALNVVVALETVETLPVLELGSETVLVFAPVAVGIGREVDGAQARGPPVLV